MSLLLCSSRCTYNVFLFEIFAFYLMKFYFLKHAMSNLFAVLFYRGNNDGIALRGGELTYRNYILSLFILETVFLNRSNLERNVSSIADVRSLVSSYSVSRWKSRPLTNTFNIAKDVLSKYFFLLLRIY